METIHNLHTTMITHLTRNTRLFMTYEQFTDNCFNRFVPSITETTIKNDGFIIDRSSDVNMMFKAKTSDHSGISINTFYDLCRSKNIECWVTDRVVDDHDQTIRIVHYTLQQMINGLFNYNDSH